MLRFDTHNHSEYSNIRLVDCIIKPKALVQRALDLGLAGFAITDHECLAGAVKFNQIQKELRKTHPEFKIALGNEIYLTDTRDKGQKYYHYILIAKDEIGFRQLRILSSRSWMQSYFDRGMERVPTLKRELEAIVGAEPGHLIATTACLGGELSSSLVELDEAERHNLTVTVQEKRDKIEKFLKWNLHLFGEDFYIECAPSASTDQIIANKRLLQCAKAFNIKMVIGCDSHFLKREDRYVHKAFLNSKDGEREVDDFYQFSYLQSEEEIKYNLVPSIGDAYDWMCNNSMEIYDKITFYDLARPQKVPRVPIKNYPKRRVDIPYPTLSKLYNSDDPYDRYWINQCEESLKAKGLDSKPYWDELEYEADIKYAVGKKLGTNIFAYPITLQHYINLIWDCGSIIGAGRGSSMAGLNHYLLGVTQIDPVKTKLNYFWRYMNKDRAELPDIDIDLSPSKRPLILNKIKKERGQRFNPDVDDLSRKNLGCTLVATFGTISTKSAVLTSCRGYRSEDLPDGIDVDTAQYLSSLVPQERGQLWSLDDVLKGNSEKGRKPVQPFIKKVKEYPGLLEIMTGIDGLIDKRSSHASGVIFFDEDPYDSACFMKTPKGEIITQWDLHDCEYCSMTKYDFLVTDICDKIAQSIFLLQNKGKIDPKFTLKQVYDAYLHPDILPIEDKKTWENIQKNSVLNLFQFDSLSGSQGIKKVKPKNIQELADTNGLIRLTAGEGMELPMDKYVRFKNNLSLWYEEMDRYGLTKEEQDAVTPYFKPYYGVPISQEVLMKMVMDERLCGFSLKEANELRKVLAKKKLQEIPVMKEKILTRAKSPNLGRYVWEAGAGPQMSYSFSVLHATAYSYIGFQTAYLSSHWHPIYWATACLIVNSGSLEE
jgi:DNA polymerase-3 subunit alpha